MGTKPRIKDIAQLAGVSAGTVDRVLHGRGRVSEESRLAVEKVLAEVNYKPNLYLSSISIKKSFKIAVSIPKCEKGEYWEQVKNGVIRAIKEYNAINIDCKFFHYDQFDLYSCRNTFNELARGEWDAVILGPTFKDETIMLTDTLDRKNIPYAFVDSMVDGASPKVFFSANQHTCGYLLAKLLYQMTPEGADYVLCQAKRIGDESSYNTLQRKKGFLKFFREKGLEDRIRQLKFSPSDSAVNEYLIGEFFENNPNVRGGAVLSSRGGVVAQYLRARGIRDIKIVTFDLTKSNWEEMKNGGLGFIICQRPAQQGFSAVKALMMYLVFGDDLPVENYMPLDIITQENLEYYTELPY